MFYRCFVEEACLPGDNGTASVCKEGYADKKCGVCADGFFEQVRAGVVFPDGVCARAVRAPTWSSVAARAGLLPAFPLVSVAPRVHRMLLSSVLSPCHPAPPPRRPPPGQFGKCKKCGTNQAASVVFVVGIVIVLAVVAVIVVRIRHLLPIEVIKLGVSMFQILASANSTYDIPWPQVWLQCCGGGVGGLRFSQEYCFSCACSRRCYCPRQGVVAGPKGVALMMLCVLLVILCPHRAGAVLLLSERPRAPWNPLCTACSPLARIWTR